MDFNELAEKRYSVRRFSDKKVEDGKLRAVLETVLLAPTAKNIQPERVYVMTKKEDFEKLDKLTHCRYGAPVVLVFTYSKSEEWKNPMEEGVVSGVEDTSIAATYVMLKATELGLYTTWCNMYPNTELEKAFNLPEDERSVLIMPIGYKQDDVHPSSLHDATRPFDELVKYL